MVINYIFKKVDNKNNITNIKTDDDDNINLSSDYKNKEDSSIILGDYSERRKMIIVSKWTVNMYESSEIGSLSLEPRNCWIRSI